MTDRAETNIQILEDNNALLRQLFSLINEIKAEVSVINTRLNNMEMKITQDSNLESAQVALQHLNSDFDQTNSLVNRVSNLMGNLTAQPKRIYRFIDPYEYPE